MCGIIGYAGSRPAFPIVVESLKRLEYRGYDSAGVAVLDGNGPLQVRKTAGKIADLSLAGLDHAGVTAIAHTRWATHGKPTLHNAHPHTDGSGKVAVVHNGIVENYEALRASLLREGRVFRSETDTEVIPLLIERFLERGASLEEAVRETAKLLEGGHAIAVIGADAPNAVIGLRVGHAGGLVVGRGSGESFLASDLPAIAAAVDRVAYLADGEMAVVTPEGAAYSDLKGRPIEKAWRVGRHDPTAAAKGPYKHFMLKEIMEQPESLVSAMRDRIDFNEMRVSLPGFPYDASRARAFDRVVLLGMGTSYHAAQVGRLMIERMARLPAEAEHAGEFRYRDPVLTKNTLVVTVTQSGETVDSLVAMHEAAQRGAAQIAVTNVAASEAARLADYALLINAGPEIAVASTKTFTGSMVCLYLLALRLGELRGTLDADEAAKAVHALARLPEQLGRALAAGGFDDVARRYAHSKDFLLLGRGPLYPIALEGALKLKEVSYIHAEGCQAGEMKHGPIALIDEDMPVLALAVREPPNGPHAPGNGRQHDKILGNIEEVRARGGRVIVVAAEGDSRTAEKADHAIFIPEAPALLAPVLAAAPLQLLAYHIAVRRGCDVDQPRNLAKTVTVE